MGLFGKLFEKKVCDICEGDIGMLGNRKLEDGNLCKNCASKLSPWFSERRHSTVDEIRGQLEYREANQDAVSEFHVTRVLGRDTKVLLDEDAKKFIVTSERNWRDENPDVLDFSQVTGVDLDIEENTEEEYRTNSEGDSESYNPPRYIFSYDFHMRILVDHPYFNEMEFDLSGGDVTINPGRPLPSFQKPDPRSNPDYREYEEMGREIREILTAARQQVREEAKAAAAPKMASTCPWCGATTTPDAKGCCEYCGGAMND